MDWNLRIYILFFKRNDRQNENLDISAIRDEFNVVAQEIEEKAPKFYYIGLPEKVILQIKRAIPELKKIIKALDENRRPVPNIAEPPINAMLVSAMGGIIKEKIVILGRRLTRERQALRVFIHSGYYWVRQQHYGKTGYWGGSVLRYKLIKYATLSQALKTVDHQIDSELGEVKFLSSCNRFFKGLVNSGNEKLLRQIENPDLKLTHLRVEEKRLARIVFAFPINRALRSKARQ